MEAIRQSYAAHPGFAALGLESWNGSVSDARAFLLQSRYSFPLLLQAGYLGGPMFYSISYDNYVVVDADGIVRYTSQGTQRHPATGRFYDAQLRAVIAEYLPLPVEPATWSGVKGLFR